MSFFRHGEIYQSDEEETAGSDPKSPPVHRSDESPAGYSWRVALQQSSPPLHQPSVILKEKRKFEKENH